MNTILQYRLQETILYCNVHITHAYNTIVLLQVLIIYCMLISIIESFKNKTIKVAIYVSMFSKYNIINVLSLLG